MVLVSLVLNCSSDPTSLSTDERDGDDRITPLLETKMITGNSWAGTLTPIDNHQALPPGVLGSFPRTTLLRLRASGVIRPYINWGSPPPNGQKGTTVTTLGPDGEWSGGGCTANVNLSASVSGGFGFCYQPGLPKDYDVALLVKGDAEVRWTPGPGWWAPPDCGQGIAPCFLYTEGTSFNWTVDKIAAQVTLAPDQRSGTSSTQLAFSTGISPATFDGVSLPFQVVGNWRFQPTVGPIQQVCAPNAWCTFTTSKSGKLLVSVIAQGDSLQLEARVDIFNCLTGDPLLDDPIIRQGLRDAWAGTGSTGPNYLRKERGGGLICDVMGVCTADLAPIGPNDDACNFYASDAPNAQQWTVMWHMHPFQPLSYSDTLPNSYTYCKPKNPNAPPIPAGKIRLSQPGPSPGDLTNGDWLPRIVVDKQAAYLIPAGSHTPVQYPRNVCDVLAAPIL
jgi:hypothetical protein